MSSAAANQPFVFAPGATPVAATGADPLVQETRREIAEIVREVATAVRSDRTADEFLTLLVDRILRAMAAEGVMIWRCEDEGEVSYRCIKRLGTVTDRSIPSSSAATHARLLWEVASDGQPVVVPATPGADDPDVPANPMEVPVALVPIECESTPRGTEYLLEVFLEPGCGVTTQRGYLRFVAQMADLAGEFLRSDQLRRLRRIRTLARQVNLAIAELHEIQSRGSLEAAVVDGAASLFGFDRVGLCIIEPKVTLTAVSHVETVDKKSPAAVQLSEASTTELDADGCVWFDAGDMPAEDDLLIRAVVGLEHAPGDSSVHKPSMPIRSRQSIGAS